MMTKEDVRKTVWRRIRPYALPPFPVEGRIPNFKGSKEAAEKLSELPEWRRAEIVKCNPDSPQRWVRLNALLQGKTLLMATPRLREGFLILDPGSIPKERFVEASTIRGAFKWGKKLKRLNDLLATIDRVDFVVEGSVAIDLEGRRIGKGAGYGDLEFGILTELKLMEPEVPIATTVHDVQVFDPPLPQDPWDVPLTFAFTPSKSLRFSPLKRPRGILWQYLEPSKLKDIPILIELKRFTQKQ